jgi:hypothetical protein
MGLQQLMQQMAVAGRLGSAAAAASEGDGKKRKVEMDLSRLGQLQ